MKTILTKLFLLLLVNLTKTMESKLGHFQAFNLNIVLEGLKNINSTSLCGLHIQEYVHGLTSKKLWAQKMYDSSANTLHGVYMGNNKFIGHYDECLSVKHPENLFQGQHCVFNIDIFDEQHGLPMLNQNTMKLEFSSKYFSMLFGICIPSTCSSNEVEAGLGGWFNKTTETGSIYMKLAQYNCYSLKSVNSKENSWTLIYCLLIIGFLSLTSTAYDLIQRFYCKIDHPHNLLIAFSVYTNTSNIFRVSDTDLKSVNGIRAINATGIIIGHALLWIWYGPIENSKEAQKFIEEYGFLNVHVAVEGFFFVSGFLITRSFFQELDKSGYYDFPLSFISKYIRFTSALSIVRLFLGWQFLNLGSGPLWNFLNKDEYESCQEGWISALLYMWNYVDPFQLCMRFGWSLNIHMQLLWLSPLILIPILYYPTGTHFFLTSLIFVSTFISFVVSYTHGHLPLVKFWMQRWSSEFIVTHAKATTWLTGLYFGYINRKKINFKLSKFQIAMGWTISWSFFLISICGSYILRITDDNIPYFQGALLISLQKVFWVLWMAWIIFVCEGGFGGLINAFLSSRFLQFLGKISFWLYMIHFPIISYIIGTKKANYIGFLEQININVIVILLTIPTATLLTILIDSPANAIGKYIYSNMKIFPIYKPDREEFELKEEKLE